MQNCPFCGGNDQEPIEDGWYCSGCRREYPTIAFKCPEPGCWSYQSLCRDHQPAAPVEQPPFSESAAERVGTWLGVGVFALAGGVIYVAHGVLAVRLDREWADLIVYVPAFAAALLIIPIRNWYLRHAQRRHCDRFGHVRDDGLDTLYSRTGLCRRCLRGINVENSP